MPIGVKSNNLIVKITVTTRTISKINNIERIRRSQEVGQGAHASALRFLFSGFLPCLADFGGWCPALHFGIVVPRLRISSARNFRSSRPRSLYSGSRLLCKRTTGGLGKVATGLFGRDIDVEGNTCDFAAPQLPCVLPRVEPGQAFAL
jgi:hypothetical protein